MLKYRTRYDGRMRKSAFALCLCSFAAGRAAPELFNALRWRNIGPFRGGRVDAVAGVAGDPTTFYFGSVGGGVWKTTNAGTTWSPIFDGQPIASIGAIAVAPSNPNVIYVGTGEPIIRSQIGFGDGVYKSSDAGKTLVEHRTARHAADRENPDGSARPRGRLCRGARARVRAERGARRLPLDAMAAGTGRRFCSRRPRPARWTSRGTRRTRK